MAKLDAADLLLQNISDTQAMLAELQDLGEPLARAAKLVRDALLGGRAVLACGNGGSAADAAHFTAELAGRYELERKGFRAIDLTSNNSLITALANDYPPIEVFARQVESLGQSGDVLVGLTTSGNSVNVRMALSKAKDMGLHTISFLGKGGGACQGMADVELIAPSNTTARVQEAHLLLYHTLCQAIDAQLAAA